MAPGSTSFTGVGKHSQTAAQMFLVSEEISTVFVSKPAKSTIKSQRSQYQLK